MTSSGASSATIPQKRWIWEEEEEEKGNASHHYITYSHGGRNGGRWVAEYVMRKEKKALLLHPRDQMTSCVAWGKRERDQSTSFPRNYYCGKGEEQEEKRRGRKSVLGQWPSSAIYYFPARKRQKKTIIAYDVGSKEASQSSRGGDKEMGDFFRRVYYERSCDYTFSL